MSQIGFSLVGSDYGSDSDSETSSPKPTPQPIASRVDNIDASATKTASPQASTKLDTADIPQNDSQSDNTEQLPVAIEVDQQETVQPESLSYPWPPPIPGATTEWGLASPTTAICDEDFQAKIANWHELMKNDQLYFNDRLLGSQAFRNPQLYAKLVEFFELDEFGSNLPKEIYDPHGFPASGYAETIVKEQQRKAEERALAHHARSQIQFVSTTPAVATTTNTTESPSGKLKA
ncbi:HCNGP-like protein-domain-containing protein [Syncephalis fuscata]|nr:HCNGP-like protein-domain-containing protein [Syncephalis fuscata]KAI9593540.1 HCNGP-like protein-domain-containing protein [Syncephalis fuscata]